MNRLEAVIFDWAGTTVDFGSLAPVKAVTEVFARHGIHVSEADARRDMGIFKKDHIRRILSLPSVVQEWIKLKKTAPNEVDVNTLFADFIPLQMEVLTAHSQLIAGVGRVVDQLRARGLRIASTTGYTRPMLDVLLASATAQGYHPEISLCPDDVGGGRPLPWMCFRIGLEFRLKAASAAVKVGDTVSDIQEALNAGMWAIGVAATGNEVGLSEMELAALPEEDRTRRMAEARDRLRLAGAHYVVDRASQIEPLLDEIDVRLEAGERP